LPGYIADNKLAVAGSTLDLLNPWATEFFTKEKEKIKNWKTQQQKKQQLDSYRAEVSTALINSFGQFKTISSISASLHPLYDYFKSDQSRRYCKQIITN